MKILKHTALSFAAFLIFSSPALAEGYTYSPDYCDFAVTFPAEPVVERQCDDAEETRCYQEISFTKVFEFSSTMRFRVICSPINQEIMQSYSGQIMQETLKALTDKEVIETYETSFAEEENFKQANLIGEGQMGVMPTLFIAQLWISENSAFSIEAELVGGEDEKADAAFSDVLKSISYSVPKPESSAP